MHGARLAGTVVVDRKCRSRSRDGSGVRDTRHAGLRPGLGHGGPRLQSIVSTASYGDTAMCPRRRGKTQHCVHRIIGRHGVIATVGRGCTTRTDATSNPEAPDGPVRVAPQGDMSDDAHAAVTPTWTPA